MISPKEPCRFNSVPVYAYDRKACALECAIGTGLLCGLFKVRCRCETFNRWKHELIYMIEIQFPVANYSF